MATNERDPLPMDRTQPQQQPPQPPQQPGEEEEAEEAPVELQPRFTEQDEARELATLTIQDLLRLQSDLTGLEGITAGLSGMGFGSNTASNGTGAASSSVASNGGVAAASANSVLQNVYQLPSAGCDSPNDDDDDDDRPQQQQQQQLSDQDRMRVAALDRQMSALPQSETEVYHLAKLRCPAEVSARRKLQFLDCEDNDVAAAARRLALYWDLRRDLFGDAGCFLPMTLGGALRGEVMNMAQRKVFQLLPHTDAAGRGIIYERWGRRDLARYTTRQEFRALAYHLHVLMQDDAVCRRGFVFLVNGSQASGRQFSRQFPKYLQWTDAAFPVRMRAAHICNASPVMHYLILPTVKRFVPRDVRLRGRLHRGSAQTGELLRCLAEYNLPADRVPVDLGGTVALDANQFLIDRISLEAAGAGIRLAPTTSSSPATSTGGIMGQGTTMSMSAVVTPSGSTALPPPGAPDGAPLGTCSADASMGGGGITDAAESSSKSAKRPRTAAQTKKKKPRNVTDPRVVRAVRAKQDDPDMSLYDALAVGGFRFDAMPGKTDIEIVDDEGISLKQRKNNLLRRLRIEKQKKEERRKSGLGGGERNVDQVAEDGRKPTAVISANGKSSAEVAPSASHVRRDSFDEEIFKLPGLDNLF